VEDLINAVISIDSVHLPTELFFQLREKGFVGRELGFDRRMVVFFTLD